MMVKLRVEENSEAHHEGLAVRPARFITFSGVQTCAVDIVSSLLGSL